MLKPILISKRGLYMVALAFMYLGPVLWLLGWTKLWLGIPAVAVIALVSWSFFKNNLKEKEYLRITPLALLLVSLATFFMLLICGYWGVFPQFEDWIKHNAVLFDLTRYDWPVRYQDGRILSYYIGSYLPVAALGRLFCSPKVAEFAFGLYFFVGVFILLLLAFVVLRFNETKKQLAAVALFFLFAGMSIPMNFLSSIFYENDFLLGAIHLEAYTYSLHFRPTILIFLYVLPQTAVLFLASAMVFDHQNQPRFWAFFLLPVILCGTMGFLGLVILCAFLIFFNLIMKNIKARSIFSVENIFIVLLPGLVFFIYLLGNITTGPKDFYPLSFVPYPLKYIPLYLIFVLFSYIIYSLIIFGKFKREGLFLASVLSILFIPFFRMGKYNEWVKTVSIPAIFFIFFYIVLFLFSKKEKRYDNLKKILLTVCLSIGAFTALAQIVYRMFLPGFKLEAGKNNMNKINYSLTMHPCPEPGLEDLYDSNYFDFGGSLYDKYVAPKP